MLPLGHTPGGDGPTTSSCGGTNKSRLLLYFGVIFLFQSFLQVIYISFFHLTVYLQDWSFSFLEIITRVYLQRLVGTVFVGFGAFILQRMAN